jgi:hypothetical protein
MAEYCGIENERRFDHDPLYVGKLTGWSRVDPEGRRRVAKDAAAALR